MKGVFATAINCMDGRAQIPLIAEEMDKFKDGPATVGYPGPCACPR